MGYIRYAMGYIRQIRARAVIRNFIKLFFYKIYKLASTFNYLGIYVGKGKARNAVVLLVSFF